VIDYYFVNQLEYISELKNTDYIIDNGYIIIKHLKLSKDSKGANRVSEYRIENSKEHLSPCPIFKDSKSSNFGFYLSINFVFPKAYQLETVSDELIVDFDITDEGVNNIKIIKSLNQEMDTSISKIIAGTSKKWKPLLIDGQQLKVTMRFHLVFYLGLTELPINFK
jgi:hypothetical protein